MAGRPYAVVPGALAAADILPGGLAGLEAAQRRAMALSAAGAPRVIRRNGKIIERFADGKKVRDGEHLPAVRA